MDAEPDFESMDPEGLAGRASPVIQCKNQRTEIAGTRLYQPDMQIKDDILFLDPSDNFFHDGDRRIVCRHRSDFRLTSNFAYALEGKPGTLSALRRQLSLFEWDAEERFYLLFSFYQDRSPNRMTHAGTP